MMKNITMVCVVFLTMTFGAIFGVTADEGTVFKAPKDGLKIDFIKGNSQRDLSVTFNHSTHTGYECADCHHKMFQLKGESAPRSCVVCHDNVDVDAVKGYKSYFKAMHKIRQAPRSPRPACVSCHTIKFGKSKEMTGCATSSCHPDGLN